MNTILIDSSAWIEYFRNRDTFSFFIDELIDANMVCTNDLILTELLPSMIHKKENRLANLLKRLVKYEIKIDWQELQNYQRLNLQHGNNNVGIADLIITQNCIQNNLSIVSRDKHFAIMAHYLPIEIHKEIP